MRSLIVITLAAVSMLSGCGGGGGSKAPANSPPVNQAPTVNAGADQSVDGARIDYKEAFWMATAGGGQVLNEKIGKFETGYQFDALVIDTDVLDSNLLIWDDLDTDEDIVQKIVYNTQQQNIAEVWVQGDSRHKNDDPASPVTSQRAI